MRKSHFTKITDKGRDYLENPPEEIEGGELERSTEEKHRGYDRGYHREPRPEVVPSQSDLLKSVGERLRIGVGSGGERKGREIGRERERKGTDEGREWLESGGGKEPLKKPESNEIAETVPSQSDLFRSIGEKFRGAPEGQFYRLPQLLL